jgi:hypothetical protein
MTRTTVVLLACVFIALVGLCIAVLTRSFGKYGDDPHLKVRAFNPGDSVVRLLDDVGPPTREQLIREQAPEERLCEEETAARELVYDIPSRGPEQQLRGLLHLPAAFSLVVCVDGNGRILGVSKVIVD